MKVSNRQWLQATAKIEKQYHTPLIRVITAYRKVFINDLQSYGKSTALSQLSLSTVINEPLTKIIRSVYRTAGLMGARMTHTEITNQVKLKAAGFGRNEQWIRDVQDYLRLHMLNMVQNITETMRQDILNILDKGAEEGLSIEEIVQRIREVGLIQSRARVIARTEIIRAANVGHATAAASLPYEVNKKWRAANDSRTRHSHVYINNHMVDELEPFKVPIYKGDKNTGQFDLMQFPGDPTAHPSNTIQCRCRVLYEAKRDEQGKLIMRNPNQARVIPMTPVSRIPAAGIAAALKAHITVGIE